MMDALDDAGIGVMAANAGPQRGSLPAALGDKNGAGAREMRGRFTQGAAREQMFVAEGLLAIDQHNVPPAARQLPVLKPIIQQQGVAAELFNRIPTAFYPV